MLTNLASVAMGFALFASNIVFPQLLELLLATGLGLSLVAAALVLAPSGLAMMAMSPVAGRIQRSRGPKTLLIAGAFVRGRPQDARGAVPGPPMGRASSPHVARRTAQALRRASVGCR